MDYKFLKSGSDIRGVADTSMGGTVTLDKRAVCTITDAFIYWLSLKKHKEKLKIAMGFDSRNSSNDIAKYVIIALKYAGCEIIDCSLASTPSLFMMTVLPGIEADGSIMISASHLPKDKNGLKFFTNNGGLTSSDIDLVLNYALEGKCIEGNSTAYIKKDFLAAYCDHLISRARHIGDSETPYSGLKVVLDASNGAGGFFASRVLQVLGADTQGSQFLEPNGDFPNHVPNPEDSSAMASISRCVLDNNADIGIIFDTDADRVAFVDSQGKAINRNRLIALISAVLLDEEPRGYIVTDSVTSNGLTKFIKSKNGRHHRYKRGYSNIIGEAKKFLQSNMNALIAIETSGHAALKENFFLDDGAYLAIRIVDMLAKLKKKGLSLGDVIADLQEPLEEGEARIKILATDFYTLGNDIISAITEWAKQMLEIEAINYEGVRVNFREYSGWFLARMSLHEPVMVINMESDLIGGVKAIAQILYNKLTLINEVDASSLLQLINK